MRDYLSILRTETSKLNPTFPILVYKFWRAYHNAGFMGKSILYLLYSIVPLTTTKEDSINRLDAFLVVQSSWLCLWLSQPPVEADHSHHLTQKCATDKSIKGKTDQHSWVVDHLRDEKQPMAAFETEQSWLLFECVESDREGLTDASDIWTNDDDYFWMMASCRDWK